MAVAITQPVLDLMGRNPEFFVAGRYTSSQILLFAVVVALVPSAVLVLAFAVAHFAHPRLGGLTHWVMVGGLGALFGNVLIRGLGVDGTAAAAVATVLGAVVACVLARVRPGRLLLQYLAAANLLFFAGFVFTSPASELLAPSVGAEERGHVSVPIPPGPVVVIFFDELPLSTLMQSDGTIDEERYPAFAHLEATATWFRNTSSPHTHTDEALPALATGSILRERVMPTYEVFPRNLLSVMGSAIPVERSEPVTDLCPAEACRPRDGQPISQALKDSLVVLGHRTLPSSIRDDLPAIDESWGSFGDTVGAPSTAVPEPRGPPASPRTRTPSRGGTASTGPSERRRPRPPTSSSRVRPSTAARRFTSSTSWCHTRRGLRRRGERA